MSSRESSSVEARVAPWLVGALSLALFLARAGAHVGLGQEGDFIAAARGLSVPYPPGAPISSLVMSLLTVLPVGPLSYRVAVACALCTALTLGMFCRALQITLQQLSTGSVRLCAGVSLLASLALAQTPLVLAQATRAQPFSVHLALSMVVFYALLRFEAEEPHGSTRILYFAAFVQGLCFANHHVYGLLLLPVAAPTLGRLFAHRGFIGLMGHLAAPLLGFSAYIYVPLRMGTAQYGLNAESGLQRVLGMLAAEPYWGPIYLDSPTTLSSIAAGLLPDGSAARILLLWVAVLGGYLALRSSSRRRFGLLWFIAMVVPLASVIWVLKPRLQEDIWGAAWPCAYALTVFMALGLTQLLSWLAHQTSARLSDGVLLAGGAAMLLASFSTNAEARADALLLDRCADLTFRELPTRAVVLSDEASHTFQALGLQAEEQLRKDLTLVPLAFRELPDAVESWAAATPELKPTLRDLTLTNRLSSASLESLAGRRPVIVELSDLLDADAYRALLDEGLAARVLTDPVTIGDLRMERAAQAVRMLRVYRSEALSDRHPGIAQRLGRAHFYQALIRTRLADEEGARDYLKLTERSGWSDPRVGHLQRALQEQRRVDLAEILTPPGLGE